MRKSPSNHKSHTNVKSKSSVMSLATPQVEDKQKHVRVKKYMFKKPEPLNTWGDEEHRSESWMELFIDLFYVAFFIKLGDVFYTCGFNVDSMMYVASVFLGIYMSKFDFDQYMNKFEGEDLVHKFFFLFYSLGNVIMILNVNETSEVTFYHISCYALLFFMCVVLTFLFWALFVHSMLRVKMMVMTVADFWQRKVIAMSHV